MDDLLQKQGFIIDMDGVIYHGNNLLPEAKEFVNWLKEEGKQFLFLTNSSERSQKELQQKLERLGIDAGKAARRRVYTEYLTPNETISGAIT